MIEITKLNYEEDSMPLQISQVDYKEYYINESLTDMERLNNIVETGRPFQRKYLIENLSYFLYLHPSFSISRNNERHFEFQTILIYIIQNIENFDISSQLLFPEGIYKSIKFIIGNINFLNEKRDQYNQIMNIVIKHFLMSSIKLSNDSLLEKYVFYLKKICELINLNCKTGKVFINEEIYDFIYNFGTINNDTKQLKLSIFYISLISQIDIKQRNSKLFKKFKSLIESNNIEIKLQISYELKYIIGIYYNNLSENCTNLYDEFFQSIINLYLNFDENQIIQDQTILSLIENIDIINTSKIILQKLFNKIKEIFTNKKRDNETLSKIFKTLIVNVSNLIQKTKKIDKVDTNFSYILDLLYEIKIINLFINECKNDISNEKIYVNTLLEIIGDIHIIMGINISKDYSATLFNIISDDKCLENVLYREKYYKILPKIIANLNCNLIKEIVNNHINIDPSSKLFLFFSKDNINNILLNQNFIDIVKVLISNNYLLPLIPILINNLHDLDIDKLEEKQKRNLTFIPQGLILLIQSIYKSQLEYLITNTKINNKSEYKEDLYKKIEIFIKKLLTSNNIGDYIKKEYIKIYTYLIKYSNNKNYYLSEIRSEFKESNSFYTRRLFKYFLQESFTIFSFGLILEKKILEDYIDCLKEKVKNLLIEYYQLFLDFYYEFNILGTSHNQIYKLIKSNCQKINDIEITNISKKIEKIMKINITKKDIDKIKDKEYKKYEEEKNINSIISNNINNQYQKFKLNSLTRKEINNKAEKLIKISDKRSTSITQNNHNIRTRTNKYLPPMNLTVKESLSNRQAVNSFNNLDFMGNNTNTFNNGNNKLKLKFNFGKNSIFNPLNFNNGSNNTINGNSINYNYRGNNMSTINDNISFNNFYNTKALNYKIKNHNNGDSLNCLNEFNAKESLNCLNNENVNFCKSTCNNRNKMLNFRNFNSFKNNNGVNIKIKNQINCIDKNDSIIKSNKNSVQVSKEVSDISRNKNYNSVSKEKEEIKKIDNN